MTDQTPSIDYGTLVNQPIHTNLQYLIWRANLGNGQYIGSQFVTAINAVSLDDISKSECRRDLQNQKLMVKIFGEKSPTITINNFHPNPESLERFVNTTFDEMYQLLHR